MKCRSRRSILNVRRSRRNVDPTRTLTLRRVLTAEMNRRFGSLRGAIYRAVVEDDVLGLRETRNVLVENAAVLRNTYGYPDRLRAFQDWLRQQISARFRGKTDEDLWTAYVDRAFKQGARRAVQDVSRKGGTKALTQSPLPKRAGIQETLLGHVLGKKEAKALVRALAGQAFTEVKGMTDDLHLRMSRKLAEGVLKNKSVEEIADDLTDLDVYRGRAATIVRTEIVRAHAEGQLTAMEELGVEEVRPEVEWETANDDKVCELCEPLEGIVLRIEEARGMLPRHPNCLPGDCLVLAGSRVAATSERYYQGDLVVIRTASGRELACTPNHPVLTNTGWVPAESLHQGCYVVSDGRGQWEPVVDDQYDDVPTSIEEVSRSFRESGQVVSAEVPLSAPDFHGDSADGQVAVVRTYRGLLDAGYTPISEHVPESQFVRRDVDGQTVLAGDGGPGFLARPLPPATDGSVSSPGLSVPILGRHPGPLEEFRIPSTPNRDVVTQEDSADHPATDTEPLRQFLLGFPPGVECRDDFVTWASRNLAVLPSLDQVVSVSRRGHDGHVYNLQTEDGWYAANGIITHNCRCAWVPLLSEDDYSPRAKTSQKEVVKSLKASIKAGASDEEDEEDYLADWGPGRPIARRVRNTDSDPLVEFSRLVNAERMNNPPEGS